MAGQTARPKFAVKPSDTSDPRLSYASSDEAVATVDEDGVVTAVAPGTCKITASTMDGSNKKGSATVRVMTLMAEQTELTVPLVGGDVIRVYYLGSNSNFKSSIKVSVKSNCFKASASYDEEGLLLSVIPSKTGTGTVTITDSKAKNSKLTLTISVDNLATARAVPYIEEAALTGDAVMTLSASLNNPGIEDIISFTVRYQFYDEAGEQIFLGSEGIEEYRSELRALNYEGTVAAGSSVPIQDRVPSSYAKAVRMRAALES